MSKRFGKTLLKTGLQPDGPYNSQPPVLMLFIEFESSFPQTNKIVSTKHRSALMHFRFPGSSFRKLGEYCPYRRLGGPRSLLVLWKTLLCRSHGALTAIQLPLPHPFPPTSGKLLEAGSGPPTMEITR